MQDNTEKNKISRRQAIKLLGMGAASAAILAACGDTATSSTSSTTAASAATTTSAAATTTSAAAAAGTTAGGATTTSAAAGVASGTPNIVIKGSGTVVMATADNVGAVQKVVDMFNAMKTGITISYQKLPPSSSDIHDKFATAFAGKSTTPDVVAVDIPWAPEFGSAGFLLPLNQYVDASYRSNFFESTLLGTTYKNNLYALPWYLDAGLLYYRKDILDKAGVQPPTNFDELVASAQKLQTADMYGFAWPGFKNEGLSADWMEYLWGFGGDYYDQSTNTITVDKGDGAVNSLQFLSDALYKTKITPTKALTWKGADLNNIFTQGNAVFMRNWTSYGALAQAQGSKVKDMWGVTPFLAAAGQTAHSCLGPWNLAINANSKNPDAAWTVIEFLTSPQAQKALSLAAGTPPSRKDVYSDPDIQNSSPIYKVLPTVFNNAKARPVTPAYQQMSNDVIQNYVSQVLTQQVSPADAVKAMASKSTPIIAKFKS